MPAAGDPVYASDVLRARATIIDDTATSSLGASQTDADIPGISIAFTTETDGAEVAASWFIQGQNSGGVGGGALNARPRITGPSSYVSAAAVYAIWRSGTSTDQSTPGNQYKFTLGVAGLYTATLRGTTSTNEAINIYSSLRLVIQEQWE